jgi:nucleotide-binding universal stress UspA family protein
MFERILVPIDGSDTARKGLGVAIGVAKMSAGRVRLLQVVDEFDADAEREATIFAREDTVRASRTSARASLAEAREQVRCADVPVDEVLCDARGERLCDRVVAMAHEWGADLIVLGTHGRRGVRRLLLGSDAEQILRVAPVPVLLVRADEPDTKG